MDGSEATITCCKHGIDQNTTGRTAFKPTRVSPFPMLSYEEAIVLIKKECSDALRNSSTIDTVSSDQFHTLKGHILAQDVHNEYPFPLFPASTRDGYAVMSADGTGKRSVLESSDAGSVIGSVITPGKCVKISTGAAVPEGADAVVMIEDTKLLSSSTSGSEQEIEIMASVKSGENIRPIGSDLSVGQIFKKGDKLNAVGIALLASIGQREVKVHHRPTVAVLSTGDEVIDPKNHLPNKHCIFDSNRPLLKSLLRQDGYEFVDIGIVEDKKESLSQKLREAFQACDVVVTSGGVSMGHKDYVKDILLADFGAVIHFGRVDMKPGKPITMASLMFEGRQKFVFGLPGNPVSVFVCYNVLFKRALSILSGELTYEPELTRKKILLPRPTYNLDSRPEFLRVKVDPSGQCECTDFNQCSSRLFNSIEANGLAFLPKSSPERKLIESGFEVDVMLL